MTGRGQRIKGVADFPPGGGITSIGEEEIHARARDAEIRSFRTDLQHDEIESGRRREIQWRRTAGDGEAGI